MTLLYCSCSYNSYFIPTMIIFLYIAIIANINYQHNAYLENITTNIMGRKLRNKAIQAIQNVNTYV